MTQAAPGWHADPLHRHPLRYWDGDAWTAYVSAGGGAFRDPLGVDAPPPGQAGGAVEPVPPAYVAYAAVSTPVPPSGGLLLAAGVIALVEGSFTALSVLAVAAVASGNRAFGFAGGALAIVALILVALTALFITAGVGGVRRTPWGRTLLIVSNSLLLLLAVVATARSRQYTGVLFWMAIGGTGLCLALAGKPRGAGAMPRGAGATPATVATPMVQAPTAHMPPPGEPVPAEPPPGTTGFSAIE